MRADDDLSHTAGPEAHARKIIDAALEAAGWIVQSRADLNLHAGPGIAVRETPTRTGPADYILFLDGRACGVLEAKAEGTTLLGVVNQGAGYARAAPAGYRAWADPLPFIYVSSGAETLFQDARDPQVRPRRIFAPHRPETLRAMLEAGDSLRARLATLPPLDPAGLRPCQAEAIAAVEASLSAGKQRALVSMATGAGKTFTACALTHRLLSPPVRMGKVLFLVDRANLGTQAKREFDAFAPTGPGLLFREEFTVQHLQHARIDPAASVVISTVQRLYSVLRGQPLDEADDERGGFERGADDAERPVTYNPAIPPETFDLIIVDECHRSIYGSWRQVLEYFDAFLIGLTATPGRHTLGFFQQNMVSEYPFECSVADGVNVDFEVWRIRTEVGERGGTIPAGFVVPHRDKETRRRRFAALDDDRPYAPGELNRAVEVPNQIRTVLQAYRDALPTQLFPGRTEVPKTLIFCQSDPHAETVTEIAREVFEGDARFAQKITYRATGRSGPELIQDFRTDHLFRIATTVDMVATGTDIKPLEVVIFLRDVRSAQYFEQMRGRGARSISPVDLQRATPSAERKDRFIIVDAVGVTESVKTPTEPLEAADQDDPADAEPDPPRRAVTRPGDLWRLGEHRLLCGDSTDAASVARVMGEDRAALLFTSPPYGNQRDYTTGGVSDWDALMQGVFAHLGVALRPDAQVLVNLGLIHRDGEWQPYWSAWLDWMRARGWRRFGLYAWDQGPGLPGDWNGRLAPAFELVFHFNREARQPNKIVPCKWAGTPNKGSGLRAADGEVKAYAHIGLPVQEMRIPDAVLRITRHKGRGIETEHPAVFPVALPEFLMRSYTDEGEVVFEPFSGSGTTLLAGQRTGRRVAAIELAPAYVDLAIARWRMLHPDLPVTLDGDGRDYDAVTAERMEVADAA